MLPDQVSIGHRGCLAGPEGGKQEVGSRIVHRGCDGSIIGPGFPCPANVVVPICRYNLVGPVAGFQGY